MSNLKKLLAVVVSVVMIIGIMLPAFAANDNAYSYSAEAQVLNDLGLYKGVSQTTFDPDLGTALDRETGVVMLLRLFGLEDQALSMTNADSVLAKFSDASTIADWAKKQVAYAVENELVVGYPDGTFEPKAALNGKAYCTLIMRQLGYTPDYSNAPAELAEKGGLDATQAVNFTTKDLIKDDLVGISYGALKATDKDAKTVIENLVSAGVVTEQAASDAGLITPSVSPTPTVAPATNLDIASVATIASKVVEIDLNTAVTAVDPSAITVKDSTGKSIAVTKAELAGYDTTGKTILVTLEANTTAGTLYTLTSGTKTVNFGGKAALTDKPTVTGISATDANEVTVTMSAPIKLDGATITLAQKYGTKAALAVSNIKYGNDNQLVLTVGDMTDATLYSSSISGVNDFDGNVMDSDTAQTFVGKGKPTDALKMTAAKANDYNEVAVQFNVNVDPSTLVPANFVIAAKYGTKAAVAVTAVKLAKKDDLNTAGTKIASDSDGRKFAILTVDGTMKDATLYSLTMSNLKTLYGVAQSTTDTEYTTTFVGVAKPSDAMDFTGAKAQAKSNTEIQVLFNRKVDPTTAANIANYSIAAAYGTKAALAVTNAVVDSDNAQTVDLTVAPMSNVLYKLTVSPNVKDIYGNSIKTDSDNNIISIAGVSVASKIAAIQSISRPTTAGTITVDPNTQIVVDFDQNVGSNATDVSHYSIDNGVGYPSKVQTVDGTNNGDKVILTIGNTKIGTSYKLTVKGLLNADGVAMDSDGVSLSFAGKGSNSTLPQIQAVMATDKQTIQVYFDRDVTGTDIKGKIWDGTSVIAGRLQYKKNDNLDTLRNLPANIAWQDADNANVLDIRIDKGVEADVFKSGTTYTQFTLQGSTTFIDGDNYTLAFGYNNSDVALPILIAASAVDKYTVKVYFDQPVQFTDTAANTFTIGTDTAASVGTKTVVPGVAPIKIDDKTYEFTLSDALATQTYYVRVNNLNKIKDKSSYYSLAPYDTGNSFMYSQFAGTDALTVDISDISVMMTDARTMKVYYPEAMLASHFGEGSYANSVINPVNYMVYKNSAAALAGDEAGGQNVPSIVDWNSDDNSATLVFTNAITGGTAGTYYLGISHAIKNVSQVKAVEADKTGLDTIGSGIVDTFAISTTDNAKPTITSVVATSDNTRLNVNFDQAVAITGVPTYTNVGAIASATEIGVADAADAVAPGILINNDMSNYFTVKDVSGNAVTVLKAYRLSNTDIQLVLATPLTSSTSYELDTVASSATNKIYNMFKTQIETASDSIQKVSFSVGAPAADTTSPAIASVSGTATAPTVTFNEAMKDSTVVIGNTDITNVANTVTVGTAYNATTKQIVLSIALTGAADGEYITFKPAVTDTAGNTIDTGAHTIEWNSADSKWIIQ